MKSRGSTTYLKDNFYTSTLMGYERISCELNVAVYRASAAASCSMKPHAKQQLRISRHAVDRFRQRVEQVPQTEARRRLAELAGESTRRPKPRWWTPVNPSPGVLFLYPHADSNLCLLVQGGTVVTVLSRAACDVWRRVRSRSARRRLPFKEGFGPFGQGDHLIASGPCAAR